MQHLGKWLKTAQADVEKQKTQDGKNKLLKKYNTEFAKKKEVLAKNYASRLQAVDKSITDTLTTQARLKGYNMVISKGVVVYGGDDITADVQKVVSNQIEEQMFLGENSQKLLIRLTYSIIYK